MAGYRPSVHRKVENRSEFIVMFSSKFCIQMGHDRGAPCKSNAASACFPYCGSFRPLKKRDRDALFGFLVEGLFDFCLVRHLFFLVRCLGGIWPFPACLACPPWSACPHYARGPRRRRGGGGGGALVPWRIILACALGLLVCGPFLRPASLLVERQSPGFKIEAEIFNRFRQNGLAIPPSHVEIVTVGSSIRNRRACKCILRLIEPVRNASCRHILPSPTIGWPIRRHMQHAADGCAGNGALQFDPASAVAGPVDNSGSRVWPTGHFLHQHAFFSPAGTRLPRKRQSQSRHRNFRHAHDNRQNRRCAVRRGRKSAGEKGSCPPASAPAGSTPLVVPCRAR